MNTMTIILISILILIAGVYIKYRVDRSSQNPGEPEELSDLNEKFLQHSHGQEVIDLVKTFNASDNMILRSILDSKGIDTYVKSNNFGDLYPTFDINNFASSVISIFSEQSAEAKLIVSDYLITLNTKGKSSPSHQGDTQDSEQLPGRSPESMNVTPELLI